MVVDQYCFFDGRCRCLREQDGCLSIDRSFVRFYCLFVSIVRLFVSIVHSLFRSFGRSFVSIYRLFVLVFTNKKTVWKKIWIKEVNTVTNRAVSNLLSLRALGFLFFLIKTRLHYFYIQHTMKITLIWQWATVCSGSAFLSVIKIKVWDTIKIKVWDTIKISLASNTSAKQKNVSADGNI